MAQLLIAALAEARMPLAEGVRAGADALMSLYDAVKAQTASDFEGWDEKSPDPRNYPAICVLVERALRAQVFEAHDARKEGFLRAVADMLCLIVDGCAPDTKDYDPLKASETAFARAHLTRTVALHS